MSLDLPAELPTSRDSLWDGALVFTQPARGKGYRYNLDPVLLSGFSGEHAHVVELGAGVGVLSILLLARRKAERVTAVELQPALARMAEQNARDNGYGERMTVVAGDLRALELPRADAVVFNPPYFRLTESNPAPDIGRDIARRERCATLADFVAAARRALPHEVSAIVPWKRGKELSRLLIEAGATTIVRRGVKPRETSPLGHVLVRARWGGASGVEELPPLVVHSDAAGTFTEEVRALLTKSAEL